MLYAWSPCPWSATLPHGGSGIEYFLMNRSYFIGIAGGSCSGKTTLARHLARRLGDGDTAIISIDSYYRGLVSADRVEIDAFNFDDPNALDLEFLVHQLGELAGGRSIDRPVYDFKTHTRNDRVERVDPVRFVVVEGLFPLYWDAVRELMNTRVFIEVSHDLCLGRRLARDVIERGRPREEVIRRYNEMARPSYDRYVLPSKRYADVVVHGERPVEESVERVMKHVEGKRD